MAKVIKNEVFRLAAIVSVLIFSTIVPLHAQSLPLLPEDAAVRRALMPDGLSCYVAENPYVKGFADYALVCRESGRTLLSMRDVPVVDETLTDSTLVGIMNHVADLGTPSGMAVIVCGDLKADDILRKLKYMSYMIPASGPVPGLVFTSQPQSKISFDILRDTTKRLATAVAQWSSPRTPTALMNTVQTAVYDKTVHELGSVVCGRVRNGLKEKHIPVADVTFSHVGSMNMVPDETFRFEVTVRDTCIAEAEESLKIALASVDAGSVSATELVFSEEAYFDELEARQRGYDRTNAAYVQMCTKAFLMNAPLAASAQRLDFLRSKEISPKSREQIFSGIASALIDLPSDIPSHESKVYFNASDTLAFPSVGPKVKLRSSKKEPLSGGVVWTFSNGFKVIYKRMPGVPVMHYALALRGGFGDIPDLARGEGAFMSDYLDLCTISGMKSDDFRKALLLAGITVDAQVNLSNVIITGQVRDRNMTLLMRTLLAVANERTLDEEAVSYWRESERLRLLHSPDDMRTVIDSLMCPDYKYSPYRSQGNISEGLMDKADRLFAELSSKMNDGVLVLAGDMEEGALRKALMPYVGAFRTREVLPKRTVVQYQPVSGRMTYDIDGSRDLAAVAMSARLPMTAENYMASEMAAMVLKEILSEALEPYGVSSQIYHSRKIYPEDRLSVMVLLHGDGLSRDVPGILRRALAGASGSDVAAGYMAACRAYIKNKYSVLMKEPEYWLQAVALRYLDGKDYTTGYAARVDAVSADDIRKILQALDGGSKVEYIINSN